MRIEDISGSLSSSFLRVHQRNIINMDYIEEFTSYFVVIYTSYKTKKNVSMTVRKKKELQKKYYSYKGSIL
jgi:LytTr DNA-binding domain.